MMDGCIICRKSVKFAIGYPYKPKDLLKVGV